MSIINGVIGTFCAIWLYNNFVGWLTFLSTAIPPIGGVIIADYFTRKKYYQSLVNGSRRKVNWVAIIAVSIGIICAKFSPGVVPINSVLGSAISYIIINPFERRIRLFWRQK